MDKKKIRNYTLNKYLAPYGLTNVLVLLAFLELKMTFLSMEN